MNVPKPDREVRPVENNRKVNNKRSRRAIQQQFRNAKTVEDFEELDVEEIESKFRVKAR